MTPLRFVLFALSMSPPVLAHAQSGAHALAATCGNAAVSVAQQAFDRLKPLDGSWV